MQIFETVSFHITKPCNAKCKFCYATFDDQYRVKMMSLEDAKTIVRKLVYAGVEKVTFAGGEPLLFPELQDLIIYTKKLGATTSLISNGFLITPEFIDNMIGWLDWVGISIDSVDPATNKAIGRTHRGEGMGYEYYARLCHKLVLEGYRLKVNTVVCSLNRHEDLNPFLNDVKPERWKVFQALRVDGQNDQQFDEIKVTSGEFDTFLLNHREQPALVPENNEVMRSSYLLVDPQGRFFDDTAGGHTYSDSLLDRSVFDCLKQINLSRENFLARGGIYNW